jgi:hypothetical protein
MSTSAQWSWLMSNQVGSSAPGRPRAKGESVPLHCSESNNNELEKAQREESYMAPINASRA